MPMNTARLVLERGHFQQLLDALAGKGHRVIGPVVRDNVIQYDDLKMVEEMPVGWTDEQEGGSYRLKRRADEALFGYNLGPHSWKKFLYPPIMRLWQASQNGSLRLIPDEQPIPHLAFIGVRACELNAILIQDRVFLQGHHIDTSYQQRRENLFIVAVNCGQAGKTCFCSSMNTGPQAADGFDLALTEVMDETSHYFVVEVGTDKGAEIMQQVTHRAAAPEEIQRAEGIVAAAAKQMGRSLDTHDLKNILYQNAEHPYWDEIAQRCLTCANCTMVCPTCFCSTIEDVTDLSGNNAERVRKWDSCYTADFSYIHGSIVRNSSKARYRQWLMHKLAYWIDQFGTTGCVGCGRCITWCPVGIDLTREARVFREKFSASSNSGK